jgi:hypothetical protein
MEAKKMIPGVNKYVRWEDGFYVIFPNVEQGTTHLDVSRVHGGPIKSAGFLILAPNGDGTTDCLINGESTTLNKKPAEDDDEFFIKALAL